MNPFNSFFLELLQPSYEDDRVAQGLPVGHTPSPTERSFLLHLLTPQTFRDLSKKTPGGLANSDISSLSQHTIDPSAVVQSLHDSLEGIDSRNKTGTSTILADPDTSTTSFPDVTIAAPTAENLLCVGDPWLEQPFEPGFIRPLPPLHACNNEVVWLNPTDSQYSIQWDTMMIATGTDGGCGQGCGHSSFVLEIKKLFSRACRETLTVQEQQVGVVDDLIVMAT
jgi:hypothetical protein